MRLGKFRRTNETASMSSSRLLWSNRALPSCSTKYRLIYQKEIAYFRAARDNVDVVRGEILPAYVQKVRDDGKLDIGLRAFGGKQKSLEVSELIMDRLEWSEDGVLPVGDKSPPEEINMEFPGVSKTVRHSPFLHPTVAFRILTISFLFFRPSREPLVRFIRRD